jgi:hypothetical protein
MGVQPQRIPNPNFRAQKNLRMRKVKNGAGERARTVNIHLGKVVLYQLSYARSWLELKAKKNHFLVLVSTGNVGGRVIYSTG